MMKWLWIECPARLWRWIVQGDLAERDVADDQVDRSVSERGLLESLGADVRLRVEELGDSCGGRVEFDAGPVDVHLGWGEPDEVPRTASRLQHPTAVEPK